MRKFVVVFLLFTSTMTGCIGFIGPGDRGDRGDHGRGYYHHHDWR